MLICQILNEEFNTQVFSSKNRQFAGISQNQKLSARLKNYLLNSLQNLKKMIPAYDLVVARTLTKRGIGQAGKIPWHLPKDFAFFKSLTTKGKAKNVCIMGRKTFQSIGKPLPNRHNVVISQSSKLDVPGIQQVGSFKEAIARGTDLALGSGQDKGRLFVIGGQKVFQEAYPDCRYIFETRVNFKDDQCDRKMPEHKFPAKYISKVFRENNINFDFCQYQNPKDTQQFVKEIPFPENEQLQYVNILKKIIESGEDKMDRTKTGTISLFGDMMRFDLSQGFPILTTKRVFWKGVVEELFWFIKGCTNNQVLKDKKVNIWNGNGTKQYLHSIGLSDRQQGDLGPVYGFQWRHWGAPYTNMHADYTNQGVDQLAWIINEIKTNPNSRRLIMSAWNVSQLHLMALPPCHIMCHFQVTNQKRLNCLMYQRSCDMGLGVPFNIASYALLTCIIAQVCGLQRGEFIHMMGDTHIYRDHIDKLKPELNRQPYPFPYLKLSSHVKNINDFKCEDVELQGYKSHGKIEMKMSV